MASEEDKNNVISTATKFVDLLINKAGLAIVGVVLMVVGIVIMCFNHWFNLPYPIYVYVGVGIFVLGFIMFMTLVIIKMVFKHQEKMKGIK